jgi:hypothetical protein
LPCDECARLHLCFMSHKSPSEANHVTLHHTGSTEPAALRAPEVGTDDGRGRGLARATSSAAGLAALVSYAAHRAVGGTYALVGTELALDDQTPSPLGEGYAVIGTFVDDAAGKSYVILER